MIYYALLLAQNQQENSEFEIPTRDDKIAAAKTIFMAALILVGMAAVLL